MDYSAILCFCTAGTPFVAMMREVIVNRRPWFTSCLLGTAFIFAIAISFVFFYTRAADSLCYNYQDVVRRLWQCSGVEYDFYDTCCHKVEDDVTLRCEWNYSRAEFCTLFGEVTMDFCSQVNYCPIVELNMSVALPPNGQPALGLGA